MSDLYYGRYQVIDQLGSGGMGIVFHGLDPLLERPVAIKTLHPARLTQPAIDRFLREARTAAKLDSPHIVRIHTIEQQPETYLGKPITVHFIVMEFVAGRTLGEFLQGAPANQAELEKRLRLFLQVLEGIKYAHSRGVVHRDLKPDNVMVTPEGVVKVMDFGLAFFEDSHSLTDAGQTMGTPAYLSPEQAMGSPADHRTDIYSLGVILFELLTGELPIMASHPAEMIRKVIDAPPRNPREVVPTLAPALELMVSRCLRKQPEARYATVDEMIAELELFLKGESDRPPVKPAPVSEPTIAPWSPPPGATFADGAPPVSRAIDFRSLEPQPPVAEQESPLAFMPPSTFVKFGQSPAVASDSWLLEAKENQGPLYQKLEQPRPVDIPAAPVAAVICSRCGAENQSGAELCQTCGMELQQKSYFKIDQEAKTHLAAGLKALEAGRFQQAVFDLQQALSRNPELGEAHLNLGRAFTELSEYDSAHTALQRSIEIMVDSTEPYLALADLFQRQELFGEVIACLQEVLRRTPADADSRCRLAFLLQGQGRVAEAVDQYRRVLRTDSRNLQANRQYGLMLAGGERPEEAIPYLEMACEADPEDAHTASLLARLYQKARKADRAQQILRSAIAHNQDNASLYADLGALYQAQGREDLAINELSRALELDQGNRDARVCLAAVYERHGNLPRALRELEKALDFHPQDLQIHRRLGELYLQTQDLDRALAHFEEVVRLDPASAAMHNRLGRLYLKKNYTDRSIEEYQRAVELHKVDPEYREDLAMAYYCAKKFDLAAEELRKAALLDGQNPDYPKAMGMLKFELGDNETAVACLKMALAKKPGDPQAHGMLGQAFARQGLSNMAISSYQKALDLDPNLHLMHLYLARAYAQAGRHQDAVNSFRKLGSKLGMLEDTRLMSEAYVEMGMSYLASHQPARAAEVFSAALQKDPRDARALHGLGRVHLARHQLPRARELVLKALSSEPRNADFLATLADLAGEEGRFGEASEILRQAISHAPTRPDLYERLGRAQRKADQPDEAIETFRRAAGIFPERAASFYWMEGRVHARVGNLGQAAHIFRRALEHDPSNWTIYRDLGTTCHKLGNIPDAVKTLRQAIERAPDRELPDLKSYLARLERELAAY